jgi:hypothetical protein
LPPGARVSIVLSCNLPGDQNNALRLILVPGIVGSVVLETTLRAQVALVHLVSAA